MEGTVIVADDDKSIRTVLAQALSRAGCRVKSTGTISTLWRWIEEGEGDVVVTDVMMPDGDALDVLPALKKKRPELSVIVMSAQNNVVTAIRANKSGAYEYLPKPFDLKDLLAMVNKSLNKKAITESKNSFPGESKDDENLEDKIPLIGRSSAMQDIYRVMARLMNTDLSVLIVGDSGTGKELVARALHEFGHRKDHPFISVNFSTIPSELAERELFGFEDSTIANGNEIGKLEQATNGTIFLDEIGDMSFYVQTSLLKVLQAGEFNPVGSKRKIKANFRILSSTNQDLKVLINEGKFREDLFYRLNVVPIKLPTLRERVEDIKDLANHFLGLSAKEGLGQKSISSDSIQVLNKQTWPGNVRELENFIRRLVVLSSDDFIAKQLVEKELKAMPWSYELNKNDSTNERLSISVEQHLKRYFDLHGENLPPPGLYDRVVKEIELPLIALSLSATRGNQLKTADLLGINRNTLRKKIKELDINVSRGKKMM